MLRNLLENSEVAQEPPQQQEDDDRRDTAPAEFFRSPPGGEPAQQFAHRVTRRFSTITALLTTPSVYAARNVPSTPTFAPREGAPPPSVTIGSVPVPSFSS